MERLGDNLPLVLHLQQGVVVKVCTPTSIVLRGDANDSCSTSHIQNVTSTLNIWCTTVLVHVCPKLIDGSVKPGAIPFTVHGCVFVECRLQQAVVSLPQAIDVELDDGCNVVEVLGGHLLDVARHDFAVDFELISPFFLYVTFKGIQSTHKKYMCM